MTGRTISVLVTGVQWTEDSGYRQLPASEEGA